MAFRYTVKEIVILIILFRLLNEAINNNTYIGTYLNFYNYYLYIGIYIVHIIFTKKVKTLCNFKVTTTLKTNTSCENKITAIFCVLKKII